MRIALIFSAALMLVAVGTPCSAQSTITPPTLQPNTRPTTSPYLFLSGAGGSGAAFNYYRQLRPQRNLYSATQQQTQSLRTLRQDVTRLEQQSAINQRAVIGPTGHSTAFFSYGSYFGSSPSSGFRRQ